MSRKISFDYPQAIERAMRVFWAKGYSNASMRELLDAMGIGEGSFYNLLKNKKHLYLECLKHYNDTITRSRVEALLSGRTVGEGVRAFFRTVLDQLQDPATPQICLMAGSLAEDVLSQKDLSSYVLGEMKEFTHLCAARLASAKVSGEISPDIDPETTARVLVTFTQGLFRVIRVLNSRSQTEKQIDSLLRGLGI